MRIIDMTTVTKEIHFPDTRAVYKPPPPKTWYPNLFRFFTYRRWFEVRKDYILWVPVLQAYIFIPNTFLFDGASVPKILNSLFSPTGMLLLGALPHDFGYRYECLMLVDPMTGELYVRNFTKKELDLLFRYLCTYESGLNKASAVAEFTLSFAGYIGWRQNRKADKDLEYDFPGLFADIVEVPERRGRDRRKEYGRKS